MGGRRREVIKVVIKQGMALALIGAGIGLLAGLGLKSLLSGLLCGVGARAPLVFAGGPLLVVCVGFVACFIPARRATRVDPILALRHE